MIAPTWPTEIIDLECALIIASRTNPRTVFDPAYIEELGSSILDQGGVLQPILTRLLPADRLEETAYMRPRPTHEIVYGECRWRASKLKGMTTIRTQVGSFEDWQVGEIQLLENLKRKDLNALEEAEGYQHLLDTTREMSRKDLANIFQKSLSYIHASLKLLDLSADCKLALQAGQIDASRALLIARIPDTALQAKALAEATRKDYQGESPSVRSLQGWLKNNVMLALDKAAFDIYNSTLVAAAGNCTTCPKRTGANPDLFTDVTSADICTDPACYHGKEAAHRAQMLETAANRGLPLIEGDEARVICNPNSPILDGYSSLRQIRRDTVTGEPAPLGHLLGWDVAGQVLIENPWTKQLVTALPAPMAEALLVEKGLVKRLPDDEPNKQRDPESIADEIKHLGLRIETMAEKNYRVMAFEALADAVHATKDALAPALISSDLLRHWWLKQLEYLFTPAESARFFRVALQDGDYKTVGERQDTHNTQMRLHVQACSEGSLYKALILYFLNEENANYLGTNPTPPNCMQALAAELDIDLPSIQCEARDAAAENFAEEQKNLETALKKAQKSPPANAPAAQAQGERGKWPKAKGAKAPAAPGGDAPLRKRKLTADEAQAAIAAAMQDQETNPGADAQGIVADSIQPPAIPAASAPVLPVSVGLSAGVRVRVTKDDERLPITQRKWCGKEGSITQQMDEVDGLDRWMVSFKGRNGGMCAFDAEDLTITGVPTLAQPLEVDEPPTKPINLGMPPIKYRGPNGETWSGRGLKPRWILAAVERGIALEDMVVPV